MPRGRIEAALFLVLFLSYAWFHQGGGWHQNARFDQVRAVVESGRLDVNDYLLYRAAPTAAGVKRIPLPRPFVLRGVDPGLNTRDLAFHDGRFYPNKPPGVTLLALPAYALVRGVQHGLGLDPDAVWSLSWGLYLTSLFSIGLLGALTGVVFHRLSRRLFPALAPTAHVAAALTLGLGTLLFPYSTAFFDHAAEAFFLLAAFSLLFDEDTARGGSPAFAGLLAGAAVLVNYAAVLAVGLLGLYAWRTRRLPAAAAFVAGGSLPALLFFGYHAVCFGGPLTLAQQFQSSEFLGTGRLFGVLGVPAPDVLVRLLFSVDRGLLFSSPVLLAGTAAWFFLARAGARRAEAALCLLVVCSRLAMNASFNGWHGGWCFGPRYLVAAVPFLALSLAWAFDRWPRLTATLALVSFALLLLPTAVSILVPGEIVRPYRDFLVPLAGGGSVETPFLPRVGPVSANPDGIAMLPAQAEWNSFNLGEFVWPRSWGSVLLGGVPLGLALGLLFRELRRRTNGDG